MGGEAKTDSKFLRAVALGEFKKALERVLDTGLMYEDICRVFADTLNNYKKEVNDGNKERI